MYVLRKAESLFLRTVQTTTQLRVAILEGCPGTGKTSFTKYLAENLNASYLYYLCHNWTGEEDLFEKVNVGRVVVGCSKTDEAYDLGILSQTALLSQKGRVVLCLDEIDKSPQKAESLLLDFLQNGRVVLPNSSIQGELSNMIVCMTTNNVRPLMEATMRRGFRLRMDFLPPNVEADLLRKAGGLDMGTNRFIVRMLNTIREKGETAPSLQEGICLAKDLKHAENVEEVELLIKGWLCKEPEDYSCLVQEYSKPHTILWGEFKKGKK